MGIIQQDAIWKENLEKNWRTVLFCSGVSLSGALCYKYLKNANEDERKINRIRESIEVGYKVAEETLCPLTIEKKKHLKDHKIEILCLHVSQLKRYQENKDQQTKNPFLPPFEKGKLICQLGSTHRLLFNKFNFYKNHLLVVTKQFEHQASKLTFHDVQQSIYVMKSLNGCFFFNCGTDAGYSQDHKHIQILPEDAFQLPLLSKIRNSTRKKELKQIKHAKGSKTTKLHIFENFEFIHGIVSIEKNEKISDFAKYFYQGYLALISYFNSVLKQRKYCHNVIGCEDFLMVIPRKKAYYAEGVGANSLGFLGSILLKEEELFERIDEIIPTPSEFFRELCFTEAK